MILAPLAASLVILPSAPDIAFHSWCNSVGIPISPSIQLATTQRSVAGRGVFAIEPLEKDEMVALIPLEYVFHSENAAKYFPDVSTQLVEAITDTEAIKPKRGKWFRRLWAKMQRRDYSVADTPLAIEDEELWQAELTEYALEAMEQNHPWATWIAQWQRDDPMHHLYMSCTASDDTDALNTIAHELQNIMPGLSLPELIAALSIRLNRMEEQLQNAGININNETAEMYSIISSRAIGIDSETGLTGIIPFYDMINHSLQPNLYLHFDGEAFLLFAKTAISPGEELFITYTELGKDMDKISALWALVQWGIPTDEKDITADK